MTQISGRSFVSDPVGYRIRTRQPPCNDNSGSGTYCTNCNKTAAAPFASEYRGEGLLQHRWLCTACGNDWVTALRVPY